jgi:hypothetical protein
MDPFPSHVATRSLVKFELRLLTFLFSEIHLNIEMNDNFRLINLKT